MVQKGCAAQPAKGAKNCEGEERAVHYGRLRSGFVRDGDGPAPDVAPGLLEICFWGGGLGALLRGVKEGF